MKHLDEQIKKIIRPYLINHGESEEETVSKMKELLSNYFVGGMMIGVVLTLLILSFKI